MNEKTGDDDNAIFEANRLKIIDTVKKMLPLVIAMPDSKELLSALSNALDVAESLKDFHKERELLTKIDAVEAKHHRAGYRNDWSDSDLVEANPTKRTRLVEREQPASSLDVQEAFRLMGVPATEPDDARRWEHFRHFGSMK